MKGGFSSGAVRGIPVWVPAGLCHSKGSIGLKHAKAPNRNWGQLFDYFSRESCETVGVSGLD